jgi:predicted phosphodiesterase
MARVLVIGDLHLPYSRKGYLQFCKDIYKKYNCNTTLFIGDVVDLHSISFHPKHPDLPNASEELALATQEVTKWKHAFPKARICIGNHDARPLRLAQSVNIPESLLKDFNEIWGTPTWKWAWEWIIDDVCYIHGTDCGGEYPAFTKMRNTGMSHVLGHTHAQAGIKWLASPKSRVFGMDIGCGIDDNSMAFAYAKFARRRSIISCGVVINGIPYHEVCPIGLHERYHDSRSL